MRNPFRGFLQIFKDYDGVWSCARFIAVFMLPAVYLAIFKHCDAGVVSAIVVGGIGSLAVREPPFRQKQPGTGDTNVSVAAAQSGPTVVVNSAEGAAP